MSCRKQLKRGRDMTLHAEKRYFGYDGVFTLERDKTPYILMLELKNTTNHIPFPGK